MSPEVKVKNFGRYRKYVARNTIVDKTVAKEEEEIKSKNRK